MAQHVGQPSGRGDISTFFESLKTLHTGGHLTRNQDETVSVLRSIMTGADSVVLAGLPPRVDAVVRSAIRVTCTRVEQSGDGERVRNSLSTADVGITWAHFAVASTGTLVEIVQDDAQKLASCLPETHVALLSSKSLLPELGAAIGEVGHIISSSPPDQKPVVSFISGPSRTGDIEMQLLYGVHGPHVVHVLVLEWI